MDMKKGTFYCISVGPGDPELLTLKAVRILERCPVIAAPQTKSGETLALDIVRQALSLEGKAILPVSFGMERDKSLWRVSHERAADIIEAHLTAGRDVAMPNLGDVSIYSTSGYLMDLLRERGFSSIMIPGVPSFCAAAARLGTTLVSGGDSLHILPVGGETLTPLLSLPGAKVLMKAGRSFPQVVDALRKTGQLERSALVEDCGLPGERVCRNLDRPPEDVGYFATIIVKEQ